MPLPTLDATIGGVNSNTYATLAECEAYLDTRLNSLAWTNAGSEDKTRALLMAAERLQGLNWHGDRVNTTQRLAWPRWGVVKRDGLPFFSVGYYSGWGYGDSYLTTEIPQPVKDAQCEWALALLEGFSGSPEAAMDSFTADGLSIKFRDQPRPGGLPERVSQLLAGLTSGNILIRA